MYIKDYSFFHRENRNNNYSFKMFLMSEFNPALIFLANIYADAFDNRQTTEVYANGVMQVSIFVSVNYNGNSDGIEDEIKNYVRDNVVILRLKDNGDKEEVDWDYSDTSNGFPHDIEYHGDGGTASDIRTPLYFTVPPGSVGKYRWIAKMGEQETSTNTPVTINARRFQPLADGSQFEFAKRVTRNDNSLCVLRYKDGVFPVTQKLMKAYEYKGIKFTKTGGNSWLSKYGHTIFRSAIFVEYRDNYINVAKDNQKYELNEIEFDAERIIVTPLATFQGWELPSKFSSSEIDEAWIDGVVIVQSKTLILYQFILDIPIFPFFNYDYESYEFQDNFGNIVEIEFDWEDYDDDWKIKSAIVRYP